MTVPVPDGVVAWRCPSCEQTYPHVRSALVCVCVGRVLVRCEPVLGTHPSLLRRVEAKLQRLEADDTLIEEVLWVVEGLER